MILLLFFCSGATALIYEVVWSRYLTLVFGSTIQAQTVVLAVFMGGLALGNRFFGGRSSKARTPLATYGYIEIAIGLYAFFFPKLHQLADAGFVSAGSQLLEHTHWLLLLKGFLSVSMLLGPTILMGGTLPLLAAWLQKQSPDAGRWSARFYSTNSLGAVAGAGLAGFFLVRSLGMVSTLQATALTNVLIGFVAVGIARGRRSSEPVSSENPAPPPTGTSQQLPVAFWRSCVLVALTGAVSMGLEVLASRSLSLIFGASLQAFAIVLMSFILGIGLGSAVVASPRIRRLRPETTAVVLLLTAACWIGILVLAIQEWVEVYRVLRTGLARTSTGYVYYQLMTATLACVVLGLPAALLGAVLPLCMRAAANGASAFGEQIGRLLTWNTVGAVVGVLLTGFVLMPQLGLRGSFGLLAVLLAMAGSVIAWSNHRRRLLVFSTGLTGLLALASVTGGEGWKHVFSSGIFRVRETQVDPQLMETRRQHVRILFYEDAADATVSVEQGDGSAGVGDDVGLRINGKPDASAHGDLSTQYLLAHLPMLARPESKDIFVFGFGSGITAGAVLGHPIDKLFIAENCRPVLRAAKFFEPWNRGVLTNSHTRIWNEDARTVLKLHPQRYDAIISEPSNPWMAGVGSVFSHEFYELAANRLKEGGLMAQWFHVYEMSDGIVALVLRTFGKVFPYVEIWDVAPGDIILLGSKQPWHSGLEGYRRVFEREMPRKDLEAIGLKSPESIWARQLASQRTGFAIAGNGPVQSDQFPVLEYEAPKAFYIGAFSRLFLVFDERTWQAELASPDKRTALRSLPDEVLKEIFSGYRSINFDLDRYLTWRFSKSANTPADVYSGNRPIPCIFRPAPSLTNLAEVPGDASEDLRRLLEAENLMRSQSSQWHEGVTMIEAMLRTKQPGPKKDNPEWSRSYFATVAARTCLSRADRASAKNMIQLGLEKDPKEPELLYLYRILEREIASPLRVARGE